MQKLHNAAQHGCKPDIVRLAPCSKTPGGLPVGLLTRLAGERPY